MTLILGIDPGKSGAFALLNTDDMQVSTYDMPGTLEDKRALISEIGRVKCCWLERPFFPRMIGIKSGLEGKSPQIHPGHVLLARANHRDGGPPF